MEEIASREEQPVRIRRLEGEPLRSQSEVFAKLRELTRSGYLPQPSSDGRETGILLRHPNAPDLILLPDGGIELPLGQSPKPSAPAVRTGMAKLRTLTIVLLAAGLWFLSLAITASLLEGL